ERSGPRRADRTDDPAAGDHRRLDRRRPGQQGRPARRAHLAGRRGHHVAADGAGGVRPAGPPPPLDRGPVPELVRPYRPTTTGRRHFDVRVEARPTEETDMTRPDIPRRVQPPPHGQVGYLQLPALEVARSAAFYQAVFGWSVALEHGSFEAPGIIGQWTTDLKPTSSAGPVLWICADDLWPTLQTVVDNGGTVRGRPQLDNGERWLVEVADPAGNRSGTAR